MAVKATVEKFGMTFADAYHKINRLNYESYDRMQTSYPEPQEPTLDENGVPVAPEPVAPTQTWVKATTCNYEVATYASQATRDAHAEPIYRTYLTVEVTTGEDDLLVQAYAHLKTQEGYEDAVDC